RGNHLEPRGHFSIHRAAEVAVVLESAADVDQETFAHLAFEAPVHAEAVARAVDLIGRLETGEHLRAGFLGGAGRRGVEVDARPGAAVAELPGRFLPGVDPVLLPAKLAARHERHGAEAAHTPE